MTIKIEKKIVAYEVVNLEEQRKQAAEEVEKATVEEEALEFDDF